MNIFEIIFFCKPRKKSIQYKSNRYSFTTHHISSEVCYLWNFHNGTKFNFLLIIYIWLNPQLFQSFSDILYNFANVESSWILRIQRLLALNRKKVRKIYGLFNQLSENLYRNSKH